MRVFIFLCLLFSISVLQVSARSYVDENNQAVNLLNSGRPIEAVELLKRSLERVPYDKTIRNNLVHSYMAAGELLTTQNRYRQLADLMREAQEFDDSQREFWKMSGYALLRLKRFDEAEVELQEAHGMGSPDSQIYFMLGKVYYDTDRMYEAFDSFESADIHSPDDPMIMQMLEKVRRELAVEKKMDKEYGGHFVITFEGRENSDLGSDVLDVLEDAYNSVGRQLDYYPDLRVPVILYSQKQFSELTNSPDWAGGLYDGKIRMPVGGLMRLDERIKSVLYHEYTHVVLRDMVGRNLPTWLNEGLAEYFERQVHQEPFRVLPLAQKQDKLYSISALGQPFRSLNGLQAILAYEQSYSFVKHVVERYGLHEVREFLLALGTGARVEQAMEQTIGSYGLDLNDLERRWKDSLSFD